MGQGQPRIIIYINFVELESPNLHVMFQDHRTSDLEKKIFKVFTIYGHGGHLGHVNLDHIYKISFSLSQGGSTKKIDFDWPSGFRGEDV